jgi:hypothetical protein
MEKLQKENQKILRPEPSLSSLLPYLSPPKKIFPPNKKEKKPKIERSGIRTHAG